ncbi:MAG: tetratricopeptide repeat protein, partial [Clostridiales bacterium]|nr:tetratricopeptide repeat protein [Clostridiales bacterium]
AAEAYGRAFALRGDPRTQMRMAKALAEAGRASEAKKAFKAALKNAKKGKSGYDPSGTPCNDYVLGECHLGLGDLKKAEMHLLRAMEGAAGYDHCVKRACFEAAFALALLYRARGDQARARQYYQKVRETVPDREYAEAEHLFD